MDSPVGALRASVERLHTLTSGLDDAQVASPSYCDEWSIAQVLSHLGSGAVILQRSLEDVRAGTTTPDDFNPSVWDQWNAKSPRVQADDALVADQAVTEAIEAVDESERARLVFHLGPMTLSFDDLVGMRLNEHAFHTWDIAAALDKGARLSDDEAALVVDNLGRIVAFSGRPDGQERTIAIHTTEPERDFALRFSADGVELRTGEPGQQPDLELPAEAFARLVYGRLDAAHTPAFTGDAALLDSLRTVFPGF
jgi:uncharacterized protein (TIGR03083 family)